MVQGDGLTPGRRLSLVLSYFRQPDALAWQLEHYSRIDSTLLPEIVVVDDASGDNSASEVIHGFNLPVTLVTILERVEWNIPGARNWGMVFASSSWCVRTDIDHVVPEQSFRDIGSMTLERGKLYLFERFLGSGEKTHRHTDSFVLSKADYWEWGGYDEALSGHYGQNAKDFIDRASKNGELVETSLALIVQHDFASTGDRRSRRMNKAKLALLNAREQRKTRKLKTPVRVEYL